MHDLTAADPDAIPRPSRDPNPSSADLILVVAVALWALNYSVVKVGLTEIQPLAFPVFRFGIGGLALLVILRWREGSVSFARSDAGLFGAAAVLGITASQISFVFAMTQTTASDTALLATTAPIVTALLATLTGVERAGRRHWAATLVGLMGAVLIVAGGVVRTRLGANLLGDGLALGNVVGSCASVLPLMPLLRRYSPLRVLTWEMLIGTALLVPVAAPSMLAQDYGQIDVTGWAALGYAVGMSGITTNLLYFKAIGRVGPSRAALYQYVQSFLAVLFAVVLLHEPLTPIELLGGGIVVASVAFGRRRPTHRPKSAECATNDGLDRGSVGTHVPGESEAKGLVGRRLRRPRMLRRLSGALWRLGAGR